LSETSVSPRKEESISTFQHLDLANDRTTVHAVVPSNKLSDDGQKYVSGDTLSKVATCFGKARSQM
jgi:hypothetical protein